MKTTFLILAIVVLMFTCNSAFAQSKSIQLNDSVNIEEVQLRKYNGNKIDKIRLNERLKIKIKLPVDTNFKEVKLYFDDVFIEKLQAISYEKNEYHFYVRDVTSAGDTLSKIYQRNKKGYIEVNAMLKIDENKSFRIDKLIIVYDFYKKKRSIWSWITIVLLVIILIIILRKKQLNFLKDQSAEKENPPYSLSRTQLAFWTLIITIAYFTSWFKTGEQVIITTQVLILLGISAGTTLTARLIDNHDIQNRPSRHQDSQSQGFLMDILSDEQGLSIHRFQNVIFTIIIGSYFLYKVSINNAFPDIDENLLVLMGISSGTYLVIKQNENKENE